MTMDLATRFLTRGDGRIGYDDSGGSGPLVVCAPGVGDTRKLYRFVAPGLVRAGYRVVTMDLRGHGESSTGWADYSPRAAGEDYLALLRHLDAGPAVLVGHSFTPAAAIWAAAQEPDLVAGVVLSGPWASDPKLGPAMRALVGLVMRVPALWVRFYRSLYPAAVPPDLPAYLRALRANLREPGRMAAARAMGLASKAQCNDRLPELRCPVLVVMGALDPDFPDPAAQAAALADRAADATVAMIEESGHYPPADQPERVLAAIEPFLARTVGVPS